MTPAVAASWMLLLAYTGSDGVQVTGPVWTENGPASLDSEAACKSVAERLLDQAKVWYGPSASLYCAPRSITPRVERELDL